MNLLRDYLEKLMLHQLNFTNKKKHYFPINMPTLEQAREYMAKNVTLREFLDYYQKICQQQQKQIVYLTQKMIEYDLLHDEKWIEDTNIFLNTVDNEKKKFIT